MPYPTPSSRIELEDRLEGERDFHGFLRVKLMQAQPAGRGRDSVLAGPKSVGLGWVRFSLVEFGQNACLLGGAIKPVAKFHQARPAWMGWFGFVLAWLGAELGSCWNKSCVLQAELVAN